MRDQKTSRRRWHAFSLVELMVAVAVVAILASLAMPRYQAFIARGRMAEAKVNLGHIATLQGIYRSEWNRYGTLGNVGRVDNTTWNCGSGAFNNPLGFAPDGCTDLRYGYNSSSTGAAFEAFATAGTGVEIYPGCTGTAIRDKWEVRSGAMKAHQVDNIIKHCD